MTSPLSVFFFAFRVSTSFRVRSPRRVDVTEGMMAGRLAILCTAVVIYLIVWTLFMRPHAVHSRSDLRFTQCSYDDVMTYVSVSGKLEFTCLVFLVKNNEPRNEV